MPANSYTNWVTDSKEDQIIILRDTVNLRDTQIEALLKIIDSKDEIIEALKIDRWSKGGD